MFSLFVCEYDNKPLNGVHMCVGEHAHTHTRVFSFQEQ